MTAGASLQVALVGALERVAQLTGVFDGPPARAAYPYLVVDAGTELDWSHKSGTGREIAVAVTLWDDQPARLQDIAPHVEQSVQDVSAVEGWTLVSLRFSRKRVLRDVAGPWAVALDFRARLLKSD